MTRGIPRHFESERLLIRAPRAGDGTVVHASVVESLDALRAFPASLPWAMQEPSVEASEQFCVRGAQGWRDRTDFPMLLFVRDSDTHVGGSGLHSPDFASGTAEIGYWCRPAFMGRGLVTEAVRAIARFGFAYLGLSRVEIFADERNAASWRVCERAGFRYEGSVVKDPGTPLQRFSRVYALG